MTEHLRAHLEAIQREREDWRGPAMERLERACEHAVAALALLGNADRLDLYYGSPEASTWAVVPDPGPSLTVDDVFGPPADPEPRAADVEPRSADEAPA